MCDENVAGKEKELRSIIVAVAALVLIAGVSTAQEKKAASKYVGAGGCKACHMAPTSGAAYKIWSESPHAKAFATLSTPAALEVAKKKGIADPTKAAECLKCHVTGHGAAADAFEATFKPTDGIQCESCHGAGSGYKAMATMKGLAAGTIKPADVGLTMPDEKTCVKCHNPEKVGS